MQKHGLADAFLVSAALWLLIAWTISCVFFP